MFEFFQRNGPVPVGGESYRETFSMAQRNIQLENRTGRQHEGINKSSKLIPLFSPENSQIWSLRIDLPICCQDQRFLIFIILGVYLLKVDVQQCTTYYYSIGVRYIQCKALASITCYVTIKSRYSFLSNLLITRRCQVCYLI